jgi:hypothetical protein
MSKLYANCIGGQFDAVLVKIVQQFFGLVQKDRSAAFLTSGR